MNIYGIKKEGAIRLLLFIVMALSFLAGCSTAHVSVGEPIEPVYPVERMVKEDVELP
jgi:hypothetical protein